MSSQSATSSCTRGVLSAWYLIESSLNKGRDTRSVKASRRMGTSAIRSVVS